LSEESESAKCLLKMTKKVLEQNASIMEKQEALEVMLSQLTNSVKDLRSSYNLDVIVEEDDKTYFQMVAKRVFGRQPTKNQYAVTHAILHNLFNSEITKIKFDKKYLT
ncbi:11466_t:CDS:2, partial [Racocetra fulgida]